MPRQQLSPYELEGGARGALATVPREDGTAGGAEAVEAVTELIAHHDWEVVTAVAVSLVPASLDPVADSLSLVPVPVEVSAFVDEVATPVDVAAPVEDVVSFEAEPCVPEEVDEAVTAGVDARLASATSAGSCPETSCTYTIRNAALKSAAAKRATDRRM